MTDLDETYTPTYETPNGLPNGLPIGFDNRCTLTNERTNELTNSYQDQGLNSSVPNAPTPVDNPESGRPEMVNLGGYPGAGVVNYIEGPADAAFTAFLANLSVAKVLRDRDRNLSRVERKRQVFIRQKSEVEERRQAEYQFTEKQLDIANRVLAAREAGKK